MLNPRSDIRIYLCTGHTDMRKGMNGLSILAQSVASEQFSSGAMFVLPIKSKYYGGMVKVSACFISA
jgi:hypothetical protein